MDKFIEKRGLIIESSGTPALIPYHELNAEPISILCLHLVRYSSISYLIHNILT